MNDNTKKQLFIYHDTDIELTALTQASVSLELRHRHHRASTFYLASAQSRSPQREQQLVRQYIVR